MKQQLITILIFFVDVTYSYEVAVGGSTIEEPLSVDVNKDAMNLRDAMSGWGTNEIKIIGILSKRAYNTRLRIANIYKSKYSEELWEDIQSETSGAFRTALKALVMPEPRFLAEEMRKAMVGPGTNEDTLLLCLMLSLPDYDTVQGIKDYFQAIYNWKLEDAIEDEVSSPFKGLLVELIKRPKFDEKAEVDEVGVKVDYKNMIKFIDDWRIDDIVYLLTCRSLSHISMLQEEYYQFEDVKLVLLQKQGVELYTVLESITDHHIKDGLVSFLSVASDYPRYCAYELYKSMESQIKGISSFESGTDEGSLTRIITTRADKDLKVIKTLYGEMFDKSLYQAIKDDTSGDYRRTLLALL